MKLLLTGCFNYSETQKEELRALGYDILFLQQEADALPCKAEEIDAMVCNGLFLHHDIKDFTNLKLIQLTSAGFDRVPVDEIKNRGISLFNARGVYSIPMAEWAVFRVLEHYKHGAFFHQEQEQGQWTKDRGLDEIAGKTVGILGAGNVGQEMAKRFSAFGAKVVGFDIHENATPYFDEMHLIGSLMEHVGVLDIVVLTLPLLPSTRHLVNREVLMALKPNAVLVNVARGAIIDQEAMCEILQERPDIYAALDVFEEEPLNGDSPLWKLKNVAISPHNSFVSKGNNERMFNVIKRNLGFLSKSIK